MTADEIKAIRAALGVSQQIMAMKVGVSLSAYTKYEQGSKSPSNKVILRLREIETEALAKGVTA